MPKCPNKKCNKVWLWNWEQDTFELKADRLRFCKEIEMCCEVPNSGDNDESVSVYTCTCGTVLGVNVCNEHGMDCWNHPDYKNIQWDTDENAAPLRIGGK